MATGHVLPLLEAAYHYRECLRYVRWAKPTGITDEADAVNYRRRLARRAVFELVKILRLGRDRTIRFWLQPAAGESWFSLRPGGAGSKLLASTQAS